MRIGELARRAGVRTSAIRFYEAKGLLPAARRTSNGYRDHPAETLAVLAFITRAQTLGFTLADVAGHLSLPKGDRKNRLQHRLEEKLSELDAHLRQVEARRTLIAELIAEMREAGAG